MKSSTRSNKSSTGSSTSSNQNSSTTFSKNTDDSLSTISSISSTCEYKEEVIEDYNFWTGYFWNNAVTATPSLASNNIKKDQKPRKPCVCVYQWKDNVHGLCFCLYETHLPTKLTTFIILAVATIVSIVLTVSTIQEFLDNKTATLYLIRQKRDLRFPNITICPKNSDAINLTLIKEDIYKYIPDLNDTDANNLITFAIAGSGFDNMDSVMKKWKNPIYYDKLASWFREWQNERNITEIFTLIHEDAGYKCSDLFIECYYAGDLIPCCDIFRFAYVMLRGRCLKLREFYQEDPALTGTLTIFMRNMSSELVERGGAQPQTILYVSDEYPDVATFPRYYLAPQKWNQLRLAKQAISMLPNSPYCSNLTENIGRGTCYVNTWLKKRIVQPNNCTLFYLQNKYPNLPVCRPEVIVGSYENVINLAFDNDTGCFPSCFRREVTVSLQITQVTPALVQDLPDSVFQLEFAYDTLQEEMFQEIVTTTTSGFISEFGGQLGLFVGISATSCVQVLLYCVLLLFILTKNITKIFEKDKSA